MDKVRKFVDRKGENNKENKSQLMKTAEDLCKVGGAVGIILMAVSGIIYAGKDVIKKI